MIRYILKRMIIPLDMVIIPFVVFSGLLLKMVRRVGLKRMKISRSILLKIGVLPVRDHYYEPLFHSRHLIRPLEEDRQLPGVDLCEADQLRNLNALVYGTETRAWPDHAVDNESFHFDNGNFEGGDAEYWYNMIRYYKPHRIVEIGSGHSTKLARLAIEANQTEDPEYRCDHICIEPYEAAWLEASGTRVIRKKVESIDKDIFRQLGKNDMLFIDSSHVIRPQGDVLYVYQEILPILSVGVIVHIHDIFTPKDYPRLWVLEEIRLWNEQYLVEAFLSFNPSWKVVGALNHLKHRHFNALKKVCPHLTPGNEPGSLYILRIK